MPIYDYQCPDCGFKFEKLQKMSDDPITDCPECGAGSVKKLVSPAAFILKGSGWYKDHYGLKRSSGGDGASAGGASSSSASSTGSADSKPAASSSSSSDGGGSSGSSGSGSSGSGSSSSASTSTSTSSGS